MRKIATVFLVNEEDNTTLLQHRDAGAYHNPNKWGLWGGHIEDGETSVEGMVRELEEEIGVRVDHDDLLLWKVFDTEYFKSKGINREREFHVYYLKHKPEYNYVQGEGDYMEWFPLDAMPPKEEQADIAIPIIEDFVASRNL